MATPLITFGLPAYSRPELLAEALASIAAQTVAVDYEVVICDDGPPTGGWSAISERPVLSAESQAAAFPGGRCRYFHNQQPLGAVRNWNRCLAEARGEWVTILHEDDLLYPEFLRLVLPRLQPGIAGVAVQTDQGPEPAAGWNETSRKPRVRSKDGRAPGLSAEALAEEGQRIGRPQDITSAPGGRAPPVLRYLPRYFLKSAMSPFPGVMLRREPAQRLGGFAEAWGPLADYEFWYRVACAGPVEVVRARGAFYRVAPGQWTERAWTRMLRLMHLLRLRIAREQFANSPRFGRWMARFFTYRAARSYAQRFAERPAVLQRALRLGRIPGSFVPSGWVWRMLKSRA
jgi:glycosyltransferase involved in cell wall biosynthesis